MSNQADSVTPSGNATRLDTTIGTLHADAHRIVITDSILDTIVSYSEQQMQRETGGFLLGTHSHGDAIPSVAIHGFLPAVDTHSRAASLTFTHDTWATMTREVERRFPDSEVVGWHHTHPGFGVFLSGYDLFIHRHFFSEPWQVALVVDPRRQELGFFQWRAAEVTDCGFVCVRDDRS